MTIRLSLLSPSLALAFFLAATPAAARDILHTVQKGQYLALIAQRYHTTSAAIVAKNRLDPKQALKPGQELRIEETDAHRRWRSFWEKKTGKKLDERVDEGPAKKEAPKKHPVEERPAKEHAEKKRSGKERSAKKPAPNRGADPTRSEPKAGAKEASDPYARAPKHPGRVALTRWNERYVGQLVNDRGEIDDKQAKKVDRLLRSFRTGDEAPIDRRLLSLLVQVSDHFGGRTIVVVSGFRPKTPTQYTKNSRHNHGKAIDFRIVGVPTEVLFAYCKRFDRVGCGYYPTSGFVHMDVRGYKTQWTDLAGPGEAPRYLHELEKEKSRATAKRDDHAQPSSKRAPSKKRVAKAQRR